MKRFPRLYLIVLILGLVIAASSAVMASDKVPVKVQLDGQLLQFDVQPKLVSGRVLVPLRHIFEALGATVQWNAQDKSITASKDGTVIQIAINKQTGTINGQTINLDVPPTILQGRTMVPVRLISEALGTYVDWQGETRTVVIAGSGNKLPVIGSFENLKALLASAENFQPGNYGIRSVMKTASGMARQEAALPVPAAAPAPQTAAGQDASGDYSTTNVQVKGVDEADIVKNDGAYIYQVNNQRVIVAKAYPAEKMQIMSILQFKEKNFSPQELYVDDDYLVVIGSSYNYLYTPQPKPEIIAPPRPDMYPPAFGSATVKALIFSLGDRTNIKQLREVELEGNYVSSRKIGPALYLIANKYIDYYFIMNSKQETENMAPAFRDSAGTGEMNSIPYPDIRYFPGYVQPNYLLVAGINLDRQQEEAKVSAYLGAGENIYASQESLFVAVNKVEMPTEAPAPEPGPVSLPAPQVKVMAPQTDAVTAPAVSPSLTRAVMVPQKINTLVYKFALDDGRMVYKGKGEVPGTILNQYSMDEYNGYFRIATTKGEIWRTDEFTSKNNVYVLDETLAVTGKLEDVAPGERIYSVRFTGNRAYMVTFRTVDPLFVIDLEDPKAPKILGALKIPGYSNYLHPYDENHVIGFGKDTIEVAQKDWQGNQTGTMAFYQGMKMAVFDITDVQNPVEKFKELIGDRGTDSELLHNPKALLFSRDKNLLAFPVTVMEVQDSAPQGKEVPGYGQFTFQGAYVYNIDLTGGFQLKGKITHLTAEDYARAGGYWYDANRNVERILYIGDTLYTVSKGMFKANGLADMAEKNSLVIPQQ